MGAALNDLEQDPCAEYRFAGIERKDIQGRKP
jgi:hypothetical protein